MAPGYFISVFWFQKFGYFSKKINIFFLEFTLENTQKNPKKNFINVCQKLNKSLIMTRWWPRLKSSKNWEGGILFVVHQTLRKLKWRAIFSRCQNGQWIYLGIEILLGQWCDAACTQEGPILFYFSVLFGGGRGRVA